MIRMVRLSRKGEVLDLWEGTPAQFLAFFANTDRTGWVGR